MPIEAQNDVGPLTITPSNVRYSLYLERIADRRRCVADLQRSQRRENGTWVDDPRPSSRATVDLPWGDAVNGLVAVLPSVLERLGLAGELTQYRLRLRGFLTDAGIVDVALHAQVEIGGSWANRRLPSLNMFLAANLDLVPSVMGAWGTLDAAIDAANATEKWV